MQNQGESLINFWPNFPEQAHEMSLYGLRVRWICVLSSPTTPGPPQGWRAGTVTGPHPLVSVGNTGCESWPTGPSQRHTPRADGRQSLGSCTQVVDKQDFLAMPLECISALTGRILWATIHDNGLWLIRWACSGERGEQRSSKLVWPHLGWGKNRTNK